MGILPWARTLKWRDELAAHTILPRSMGVNWAVNEPRSGCGMQYCAFEFLADDDFDVTKQEPSISCNR